jgi:hypothetical protein
MGFHFACKNWELMRVLLSMSEFEVSNPRTIVPMTTTFVLFTGIPSILLVIIGAKNFAFIVRFVRARINL